MAKSISLGLLRKGKTRTHNENNVYVLDTLAMPGQTHDFEHSSSSDDSLQFYGLADGMGGGLGEAAAQTVLHVLDYHRQLFAAGNRFEFMNFAKTYVDHANQAMKQLQIDHQGLSAGSMLSLLVIHRDLAYTISLGSSRIYLYRDNKLYRMTDDHLRGHPGQFQLTKFVGLSSQDGDTVMAENMTRTVLNRGDIFLVTSDGITQYLEDPELAACLADPAAFVTQIRRILDAALRTGGRDNMAVLGVKILDPLAAGQTQNRHRDNLAVASKKMENRHRQNTTRQAAVRGDTGGFGESYRLIWFRPVLVFLIFVLLGILLGKLLFSLPGWVRQFLDFFA